MEHIFSFYSNFVAEMSHPCFFVCGLKRGEVKTARGRSDSFQNQHKSMDGTMANIDKSAFLEGKALKPRVLQKKKKISKEKECLRSHAKKRICQLDIDFEDDRDPLNILGISTFLSVFFPSGELKEKVLFLK